MATKQTRNLKALNAAEHKAWIAFTRGQGSVAEARVVFGKDEFYTAWVAAAADVAAFVYTREFGRW